MLHDESSNVCRSGGVIAGFSEARHADLLVVEHDGFRVAHLTPVLVLRRSTIDARAIEVTPKAG
jgi:hypothetical protein